MTVRPVEEETVLVTGATGGLGRALVLRLAEHGATVVAHGRSTEKLNRLVAEVEASTRRRIHPVQADLSSLREVDRLADTVLDQHPDLTVLVNNAGVGFGEPGSGRELSRDGIELRFAVNHLASYHLARRLAERLQANAPARIVQVASAGQLPLDPDDPMTERGYDGVTAYRRSKLAQVMATFDLAADLVGTGVSVNAVHPATFMDTTMVREAGREPVSTIDEGLDATWQLVAGDEPGEVSGCYFDGRQRGRPDPQADDPAARAWVRQLSDFLIGSSLG
jgi:NAD(P)-dependent dehydrogenase (short-subunit alcohol dehydrogenase family)